MIENQEVVKGDRLTGRPVLDLGCHPMYPKCVGFLRKTLRVREIVTLVHLSHSHGFAQKRNAFRIHGTAPWDRILEMCDNSRMRKYHSVFF